MDAKGYQSKRVFITYHLSWSHYQAIEQRLYEVVQRLRSLAELDIKKDVSRDVTGQVQLRFHGEELKRMAVTKKLLDEYVRGFIAVSDERPLWHDFFGTPSGLIYLKNLARQHGVYIQSDLSRSRLALFGVWQKRLACLLGLAKKVEEERQWERTWRQILLDMNQLSVAAAHDAPNSHDDEVRKTSGIPQLCPVCMFEIEDPYDTHCNHSYCKACFKDQCSAALDGHFPLQCHGLDGACSEYLSLEDLENGLTAAEFEKLLGKSFAAHIRQNSSKYHYCPKPGCDTVYQRTNNTVSMTCTTCFTCICTRCGSISHEGLTCEQHRKSLSGHVAFVEWKDANMIKDCTWCGTSLDKAEGCRHIQCGGCGMHSCWDCMIVFKYAQDVYTHIGHVHHGLVQGDSG